MLREAGGGGADQKQNALSFRSPQGPARAAGLSCFAKGQFVYLINRPNQDEFTPSSKIILQPLIPHALLAEELLQSALVDL